MVGRHQSEETKLKISNANKGRRRPEEWKEKIRELNKVRVSPMLGKHHSEEWKRKISEAKKEKHWHPSEEARKKMSLSKRGENHPLYGKYHTEETKRRMSDSHKGRLLGTHRSEIIKQKISQTHRGKFLLGERSRLYGKRGAETPNWKGGITPLYFVIRNNFKFRQWRSDVFTRDNFTCQQCGSVGYELNAHHKKSFSSILQYYEITTLEEALNCEELWNINNGITLCKKCHKVITKQNRHKTFAKEEKG